MPPLAHKTAVLLLTALYAAVGATGQSLFYLAGGVPLAGGDKAAHATPGSAGKSYLHSHGDGFWHHHAAESPWDTVTTEEDGPLDSRCYLHQQRSGHSPHSCVLLALASVMGQSLSGVTGSVIHCLATSHAAPAADPVASASGAATLGARGPPLARA